MKLTQCQEGLTAMANRFAASDMPPADRDAAGTAVGDAIDAAQDIRVLRREPDPDQHARRARAKEMIEQLRAAAHDARALRGLLRTVAATWSADDIDLLVVTPCLTSRDDGWGPGLARCLARQARVRYWVPEPYSLDRLVRGPGHGTRLWCQLRGVRLEPRMYMPEPFSPFRKPAGTL